MQRGLSQIKEQDGLHQAAANTALDGIDKLLSEGPKMETEEVASLLDSIRESFIAGLSHAEERVALAEHIHQSVKGHIVKLEDDLKHFEEEVRLAKLADSHRTISHFEEAHDNHHTEHYQQQKGRQTTHGEEQETKQRRRTKSKEEMTSIPTDNGGITGRKRSRNASQAEMASPAPTAPKIPAAVNEKGATGDEPTYCYCGQPSYGEMIGCDAHTECEIEWFHYGCVGLERPPKDQWFCPDCSARMARNPMAVLPSKKDGSSKKPRPAFVK